MKRLLLAVFGVVFGVVLFCVPAYGGDCDTLSALIARQTVLEQRLWVLQDRTTKGEFGLVRKIYAIERMRLDTREEIERLRRKLDGKL